jgi:hypothetical protein
MWNQKTLIMENAFKNGIAGVAGNKEHREGELAHTIEEQTAKLPSDTFLWASVAAMAASLTLKIIGKNHTALFVGQWAAPFLLFGIYNKIVKVSGHDHRDSDFVE